MEIARNLLHDRVIVHLVEVGQHKSLSAYTAGRSTACYSHAIFHCAFFFAEATELLAVETFVQCSLKIVRK